MWRCEEVYGKSGRVYGVSVEKYVGVWGEVRRNVGKGKGRCGGV